jgi:hypothetical protein
MRTVIEALVAFAAFVLAALFAIVVAQVVARLCQWLLIG